MIRRPPRSTLFPTRRSSDPEDRSQARARIIGGCSAHNGCVVLDRKSTRLNSSHTVISYAVFCLKKKKKKNHRLVNTTTHNKRAAHQRRNIVKPYSLDPPLA